MRKLSIALVIVLLAASGVQASVFMEWRAEQRFQFTLQGEHPNEIISYVDRISDYFTTASGVTEFRIHESIVAPWHVMVFIKLKDLHAHADLFNDLDFQMIAGEGDYYHQGVNMHLWTRAPWAPETIYGDPDRKGQDAAILQIRASLNSDYAFVGPNGEQVIGWASNLVQEWADFPGVVSVSSYYLVAAGWQALFKVRFRDLDAWAAFQNDEDIKASRLDMRQFFNTIEAELWEPFHRTPQSIFPGG